MHSVGNKIKEYRMKNNMTQEGLAKLLMVSDKTISSYECDRTMPDINTLFKIANIFKTSIFSLIDDGIYDNKVELELKLKVDNDTYKKVLKRFNSTSSEKLEQIDTYYIPKFKDFNDEWLRIRNENGKNILSYKKRLEDNYREEIETIIDNYNNLHLILTNLGFQVKGRVTKNRIKILYKDKYEFSFDDVKNIGLFIEIEVKKIEYSVIEEIDNLYKILNDFSLSIDLIDSKKYYDYL